MEKNLTYILYFSIFFIIFCVFFSISSHNIVLAEVKFDQMSGLENTGSKVGYFVGWTSPEKSIALSVGYIMQGVLVFIGIIFMVLILMGAFEIQGSGGNEEAIQKGKLKIKNGAVGMAIVLGAYLVSHVFLGWLTGGQTVFKI